MKHHERIACELSVCGNVFLRLHGGGWKYYTCFGFRDGEYAAIGFHGLPVAYFYRRFATLNKKGWKTWMILDGVMRSVNLEGVRDMQSLEQIDGFRVSREDASKKYSLGNYLLVGLIDLTGKQ